MKSSEPRTIAGPFTVQDLGHGAWLLTSVAPAAAEIYMQLAHAAAAQLANAPSAATLGLAWRPDGAEVTLAGTFGVRRLDVRTAIVHESRNQLYRSLPVADFDLHARRFWTRIFRVMRFPGGRYLLRFMPGAKR